MSSYHANIWVILLVVLHFYTGKKESENWDASRMQSWIIVSQSAYMWCHVQSSAWTARFASPPATTLRKNFQFRAVTRAMHIRKELCHRPVIREKLKPMENRKKLAFITSNWQMLQLLKSEYTSRYGIHIQWVYICGAEVIVTEEEIKRGSPWVRKSIMSMQVYYFDHHIYSVEWTRWSTS